jgi:intracellular sulfur oxidation DsrE/DsrF family protein
MGVGLAATSQTVASDQEDAVEVVVAVVAVAVPASRSQTVLPFAVVAGSKFQIILRSVSAASMRRKDLLLVVVEAVPSQKGLRSVALVWVAIGSYRN